MAGGLTFEEGIYAAVLQHIKECSQLSLAASTALVLCLALFFAAVGVINLYIYEQNKIHLEKRAMKTIRDFMIKREPSLQNKNDSEILRGAQKLAEELVAWNFKVYEVQVAIEDLITKFRLKWMPHAGLLYLFEDRRKSWFGAKQFCEEEKSWLTFVEDVGVEEFLEKETEFAHEDSWIGLRHENGNWKWHHGPNVVTTYWMSGQPDKIKEEPCVILKSHCSRTTKCWENIPCNVEKRWICKKMPDRRWYTLKP